MDLFTALEMAGNPLDLVISYAAKNKPNESGWLVMFMRGEGHNYKRMLDGVLPINKFPTIESVLGVIKEYLYSAMLCAAQYIVETENLQEHLGEVELAKQTDGPWEGREAVYRKLLSQPWAIREGCLTLDQVDRIIDDLTKKGICHTYRWE